MARLITWIYFEFRHMRLSALREQIFGVHILATFNSRLISLVIKINVLELECGSFNHESHFK